MLTKQWQLKRVLFNFICMLLPKKVKHRKWHKPRRRNLGVATRLTTVAFLYSIAREYSLDSYHTNSLNSSKFRLFVQSTL